MSRTRRLGALACLGVFVAACDSPAPEQTPRGEAGATDAAPGRVWLRDEAAARGLTFTHHSGHQDGRYLFPESMGGGVALLDADLDGDLDVYLVQSHGPDRLFRNDAGRFIDVTHAGAPDAGYGTAVASGDYDGDGDPDLYVLQVGPNRLLRNDGGLRFTDVTDSMGVGDAGFGTAAAFVDYDRDGRLDLWVVNYVEWSARSEIRCVNLRGEPDYCAPDEYDAPAADVLYHNEGGRFRDVSRSAGVARRRGTGLGIVVDDFDADGWPDVFVAQDRLPDALWINQAGRGFVDEALERGCAVDLDGHAKAGMGVALEDVDADGASELLVGNFHSETDSLFRIEAGGCIEVTPRFGLASATRHRTRFGLGFADLDQDGWLDLFEATGRVVRQTPEFGEDPYAEPDLLLRGGPGGFVGLTDAIAAEPASSRGAAFGDLDGDGGVDVVVAVRDGPVRLLRNVSEPRGAWLRLQVLDARGTDAVSARVRVPVAGRTLTRSVRTAYSYAAASDPAVHFGLGASAGPQQAEVEWPDGKRERFTGLQPNRSHVLRRGAGEPVPGSPEEDP